MIENPAVELRGDPPRVSGVAFPVGHPKDASMLEIRDPAIESDEPSFRRVYNRRYPQVADPVHRPMGVRCGEVRGPR